MSPEIEFESVTCNLCGSSAYDLYMERGDLNVFLPGIFTLVRCRSCGLIYQNPRPSPSSWDAIYPSEYDQYNHPDAQHESILKRLSREYGLAKRTKFIRRFKTKGSLLDVGCADGDFLKEMSKSSGWNVAGIEPHPEASQAARENGLNVRTGTLEDLESFKSQYDVITLWHVIEHLYDPNAALKIIYQLLRPGGVVVLTTSNQDSMDARIFGKYWIGVELPRHFYIYSIKSMNALLEQTGFTLIHTSCFYGSHAAFMSSVRFWLRRNGQISPKLENVLFSLPIRIFLSPFFFLIDHLKASSPVTFVAVKRIDHVE
jgi:SAM-dependent methyltransferase